ncbi:MAG: DUF1566 domain-containing protein [Bacteroidota bacterium]
MKKAVTVLTVLLFVVNVYAQAPQKMSYQAVIRNSSGTLLTSTAVGMQISILQGSSTGTPVYSETQTPTTNVNGLVSIEIGGGAGFDAINWANGPYFIKTETDVAGGINYSISGTSQLLSIPYALHSKTADSLIGTITETDPVFTVWDKSTGIAIPASQITDFQTNVTNNTEVLANTAKNTYPTVDSLKLAGIEAGAKVNVNADWNATSGDAQILNKPVGNNTGDMQYWNGTAWVMIPVGIPGQFLQLSTSNIPAWLGATFPTLTTTAVTLITNVKAKSGGNITNDGGSAITARGVCWSTSINPTTADSKTTNGSGTGTFTSNITGLAVNTTYYVRSYAISSTGKTYGNEESFTTVAVLATLSTTTTTSVTTTSASGGGNITNDGGATITASGVCWSSSTNPTTLDNISTDGTGTGIFTSSLTGLTMGTVYYVRAYATNSIGTAYGDELSFTAGIGVSYQGGVLAYVLQSGDPGYDANVPHGLIAAPSDQSTGIAWDNGSSTATGAIATALGTGNANTITIAGYGSGAAQLCNDLVLNSNSDWYLPSKDELNKLYLSKAEIGGFSNNVYWSSSEFDTYYAANQYFFDGTQYDSSAKYVHRSVRAIRSF